MSDDCQEEESRPHRPPRKARKKSGQERSDCESVEDSSSGYASDRGILRGSCASTPISISDSDGDDAHHAAVSGRRAAAVAPAGVPRGKAKRVRKRPFRLKTKQFAITYPRCEVERSVFDDQFRLAHGPVMEFASAREAHADGGYHLHVYVAYQQAKDVQSARAFDVAIDGVTYHPNIQRCKCRADWLKYISKEHDNGVAEVAAWAEYNPLDEKLGERKAKYHDHLWSLQYALQQSLREPAYPIRLECDGITYELSRPDPAIKRRSWWIVAPPNAGKTRWVNSTFKGCRIYSPRTGKFPFEGYCDQDIILYDDRGGVAFEEFASVLNTWDIVQPIAGEIRYITKDWKVGHTRSVIVLSNKTIEEAMEATDVARMRKRFIQIVNPVLLQPGQESPEPEGPEIPQGDIAFAS